MTHPRTAIEKMVGAHCVGWEGERLPRAGDFVMLRPRHVMTHDNTSAVMPKFRAIAGAEAGLHDPSQPVFAMDHDIQNHTPENLGKYARIRAFAERRGVRYYPPGRGIAHQVMVEEGFVEPGALVVASDSHANMYGALNALGTPVVRTDAAGIWATGQMWWTVPPQVRVILRGSLAPGVTGKDVILALCSAFSRGEVLNACVEFAGDGVGGLSIDDRLTIANMTTEWGCVAGLFPFDERLRAWLEERDGRLGLGPERAGRAWADRDRLVSDEGAVFVRELELDLSTVRPRVCGPNSVSVGVSAEELAASPVRIDKAYLMSCVNGRLADLQAAASVFAGGGRVAPGVELYIAAASSRVEDRARASGVWQTLLDAGAIALPPGCGACIGLGRGTLGAGEVGVSATNRNFDGRMGHRDSLCYLASPAVVAESAARGFICLPGGFDTPLSVRRREAENRIDPDEPVEILDGFPARVVGRSLIVPRDDLNTDQIYAKEVTYRDDLSVAEQGTHAMRNHDPAFAGLVRRGDVLVAGANFGCGSSREQAATALIGAGVAMVIAGSVSQTYQRNAFNNGLIVIECPGVSRTLIEGARVSEGEGARTVVGPEVAVDFASSSVRVGGRSFPFTALNAIGQRLIVAGGLEAMLRQRVVQQQGALS